MRVNGREEKDGTGAGNNIGFLYYTSPPLRLPHAWRTAMMSPSDPGTPVFD